MDTFDTLPVELISNIAKFLPPQDVKNLSRTNWLIRNAIIRLLFHTLYIPCPLASTRALDEFIKKYQDLISRIHLHVYFAPNMEGDYWGGYEGPMTPIWGTPLSDTLKNLVRGDILSHVDSFTIHFDPGQFENDGWWGENGWWGDHESLGSIHVVDDEEEFDMALGQEGQLVWRAQYNELMHALSANQNITTLRFSNLVPKIASAWDTPEWSSFLGRLTDLTLSVFGADDGACAQVNTMDGFREFISPFLPYYVLQKTANLRHLSLEASPNGVIGSTGHGHNIPVPLRKDQLLNLRSLKLKNIMIGPHLLDFLESHVDCLEELELHDCMCDRPESYHVQPSWGTLWRTVRERNFLLRRVSVVQDKTPPLMWEEKYNGDDVYDTSMDSEAAARIRKMLEQDESLVLWRYSSLDNKYGFVFELPDDNIKHFEKGRDQREYLELLEVVAERNKRGTGNS